MQTILKSIFILVLFTLSISAGAAWVIPPAGTPPANNIPPPINTGGDPQSKIGAFAAGGLRSFGLGLFDGFVGIGTVTPAQPLDVVGNVKFTGALMPNGNAGTVGQVLTIDSTSGLPTWGSSGAGVWTRDNSLLRLTPTIVNDDIGISTSAVIYKGTTRFLHNKGPTNVFLGLFSGNLNSTLTGGGNVGAGVFTLQTVSSGSSNTAIGESALAALTTGSSNTAVGKSSLFGLLVGNSNTAIGNVALNSTSGSFNTGVGDSVLQHNTTGDQNTAIGASAGPFSGALTNTTAIGAYASASVSNSVVLGNDSVTSTFTKGGVVITKNSANITKPTCDSSNRGMMWFTRSATNIKDLLEVCAKDATNAYAWRLLY